VILLILVKRHSELTSSRTEAVAKKQLTVWRRTGTGILTVVREGRAALTASPDKREGLLELGADEVIVMSDADHLKDRASAIDFICRPFPPPSI
jgi:D-arabinose 1-dehydrogenase-like Zn-dependent alcohol dehydrogenase